MKSYYYYPGCSMDASAVTYRKSFEFLRKKLGLNLKEIKDWSCCGSTAAHTSNEMMALALPARNIAKAEAMGEGFDIVTPCAACYSRLCYTTQAAREDEALRDKIELIIERPFSANLDILNFLDLFGDDEVMEKMKECQTRSLKGLKAACYYGCLMVRPRKITGERLDTEDPMLMEKIISVTGAEPVDWAYKTECCGASHHVDAPKAARPLLDRIFKNAKANGADCIVTACPLCNMNLDMREEEINKTLGRKYDIPVFQFTELLAVACGAHAADTGVHQHMYPAFNLINRTVCENARMRKDGE